MVDNLRVSGGGGHLERALASHGRFHVIAHELSEAQDHDAECRAQLGSGFRLADWNDIVSYYEGGGSLSAFTTRLKMVPAGEQPEPGELGNGYRISRDGNAIDSGRRHYFVARHDHNKPSFFLDHANLDNHHVSLGSWYGTGGYALCYGDGSGQEDGTTQEELHGRSGEVRVNIEWDADVDLDLYVTNPCGQTFGYSEQTTATCQGSQGEWDYDDQGDGYRDDDPHAENIVWGRPAPQGSYRVALNYFDGSVPTNYTIRVFYGEESRTYTGRIGPADEGTRRHIADFQFR